MKDPRREAARAKLEHLLSTHPSTQGMYVRVWGDHLILGRHEPLGPDGEMEPEDRLRLTALNQTSYGLSVRRHTGRWQKTPFQGTMTDLTDIIWSFMQHVAAPYP